MPPTELAEAPVAAKPADTLSTKLGDVWTARMAARTEADSKKGSAEPVTTKPVEAKNPEAKVEVKPEAKKEADPDAPKPKPLDAIIDGAKPAEYAPKEDTEIPANAPAKQLREAYERRGTELAKLKTEIEAARKPNPAVAGELETLRKERDDWQAEKEKYTKAITAIDVKFSPEHQEKYVAGMDAAVGKAADRLKSFGGDPDALKEALSLPQGKLRSAAVKGAISELDEIDRTKVLRLIDGVETLEEERDSVLKDPQKAWADMTKAQQEVARKQAEDGERVKAAEFERVTKALPEKFLLARMVPEDVDGAVDHNARVQAALDRSQHLLSDKATFQEVAEAAAKAPFADWLQEEFLNERTARLSAEKELAALRKAEPGVRGGGGNAPGGDKLTKSPGQLYREGMARRTASQV